MTIEKRALIVVFFTVLMDLIGFGILIPIAPFFAESLGASAAMITMLSAGYSLMQFVFAPFWGRLSDRWGRRPIILTSIAIATVGYVSFAFSESFAALAVSRLLSGFGTANFGAAQAIVADTTTPERRARGMGILGAAFGLGFIFGPAIGGTLGQWGLRVPIFAAAILSLVNGCLAFFLLPETRPEGQPVRLIRSPLHQIAEVAKDSNVRKLLWVFFVYSVAFSMMEQVLALFIERVWVGTVPAHPEVSAGRASVLTAVALIVVGVTAAVLQGAMIGKLVRRFGEKHLMLAGCAIVGVALILIPLTGRFLSFPLFLADMVLLAVGSGIFTPSLSSLLSRATRAGEQGHVMGVGQSLSALGRVVGPASAGALFQLDLALPYVLGGGMILGCSWLGSRFVPVDSAPATAH